MGGPPWTIIKKVASDQPAPDCSRSGEPVVLQPVVERGGAALAAIIFIALVVAGTLAAFVRYDSQTGRVARNVTLAGERVGGLSRVQLQVVVNNTAQRYADAPVEVVAPPKGFASNARELGLVVQVTPTVDQVMTLDRSGSVPRRLAGWIGSFFGPRVAPLRLSVDEASVRRVVAEKDIAKVAPTEPGIKELDGRLQAVVGKPGSGINAAAVIARLPAAAAGGLPVRVEVQRGSVPPRFSFQQAARLAADAQAQTAAGLQVQAGNKQATVPAQTLRAWLRSRPTDSGLTFFVDEQAATDGLRRFLPDPDPKPQDPAYSVTDGRVVAAPGKPGLICCAESAGALVASAVAGRSARPVVLPVKEILPKGGVLPDPAALGLKELVSTFTTNHAPGQPRVTNIHLMADLIRGQVIEPGGTFSVNRFVGERTAAKGFVVDKVIEDGKFGTSVGGGISQFATTLFNAAFFAGMEYVKYQSHSLYISRYPYGREATLSYPNPDLELRNPSPYSVLIWTSYTGSSITVSLYSTKWVDAVQSAQTETPRGPCKLVRTERTRTILADGTRLVDWVNALYRPSEGVNCTSSPSGP